MSRAKIIDLLAKEITKGYPLITCLKISLALDDLIEHRQENMKSLYEVANELDKHTQKSYIAKAVGSAAGTSGKTALGVGIASIAGAPFTGFISGLAGGVLVAVGGTAAILGSATSAGTYAVEYWLCKKELEKANEFIKADKMKVEKYQKVFEELKTFCSQYDPDDSNLSIQVVISMFNKFKDYVKDEKVDFKGIAEMLDINFKDITTKIKELAEFLYSNNKILAGTTISLISSNPMAFVAGGGASVLFLDVFVLFKNTYNMATNEGHPTANELRNTARNLEKETQKLEQFSKGFNEQIEVKSTVDQNKNLYINEVYQPTQIEVKSTASADHNKNLYDDDSEIYQPNQIEVESTASADQNENLHDNDEIFPPNQIEVKCTASADQNENLHDDEIYQPNQRNTHIYMHTAIPMYLHVSKKFSKLLMYFVIILCACIIAYACLY